MQQKSLVEVAAELRIAFPSLTDLELAEIALQSQGYGKERRYGATVLDPVSVNQVVTEVRKKYLIKEKNRIRAKVRADGGMNIKDTTTYRTHDTFWKRLVAQHGEKLITEIDIDIIEGLAEEAQKMALQTHKKVNQKRVASGLPRVEHTGLRSYNASIDAVSVVLEFAVRKKYIPSNPAHLVKKAAKRVSTRQALTHQQLQAVLEVAISGGNDPVLDYLLVWTLAETAARRAGLINLQLGDIEIESGRALLRLYEKGSKKREQPITLELADTLLEFAALRGSTSPDDPVFRYLPNSQGYAAPLTAKRFETLWKRIRTALPWAAKKGVSSHWVRHTTITWIDRAFNPTIAQAFAGHAPASTTAGYSKTSPEEIAAAHAALTGKTKSQIA